MSGKAENRKNNEDDQPFSSSNPLVAANTAGNEHLKQQILNIANHVRQATWDKYSQEMMRSNIDFIRGSNCSISWNANSNTAHITDASATSQGSSFIENYNAWMNKFNEFRESQNAEIVFDGSLSNNKQIMIKFLNFCSFEVGNLDRTLADNIQLFIDRLNSTDFLIPNNLPGVSFFILFVQVAIFLRELF